MHEIFRHVLLEASCGFPLPSRRVDLRDPQRSRLFLDGMKNHLLGKVDAFDGLRELALKEGEKICFIFGAGASFGYKDGYIRRKPPIVADLFNDNNEVVYEVLNREEHRFVKRQAPYFKTELIEYENDLEKFLSFLYDRHDDDDTFTLLLMYLHDIYSYASEEMDETQDYNNYIKLINKITTWRGRNPWTCISFNYDTLLEQSIISAGRNRSRTFESEESYIGQQTPKIIKIHGSVNFYFTFVEWVRNARRTDKEIFSLMMNGKSEQGEGRIVVAPGTRKPKFHYQDDRWDGENNRKADHYIFPLMMIPIHGTKRAENEFFNSMIDIAVKEIMESSIVVSIGYNFGDELFLNKLKSADLSNKSLILVGADSLLSEQENHASFKNASKVWDSENIKIFDGSGFASFAQAVTSRFVAKS